MFTLGVLLLLLGIVLLSLSQNTVEVPPQENTEKAAEEIKRDGAKSLSVQANITLGEMFTIEFALLEGPEATPLEEVFVYTNITNPLGNVTEKYVILIRDPYTGSRWVTIPGDWNATGVANSTGTYKVSIFSRFPIHFVRLTLYTVHIEEGKIVYPYSFLYYAGIPTVGLGLVLSVFGALSSKARWTRRMKRKSKTSYLKKRIIHFLICD